VPSPPLWAPWRIDYILGTKPDGCFLCIAGAQPPSEETLVVHRGDRAQVMLNRHPYAPGHLMVAPVEHGGDLALLEEEVHQECASLVRRAVAQLGTAMQPDGFNVGINLGEVAGAGVPGHLHWHIVPRWRADTNFMPVLADVRVVPEHLRTTWRKLRAGFEEEMG
jgi:ATP adenylyltransferase